MFALQDGQLCNDNFATTGLVTGWAKFKLAAWQRATTDAIDAIDAAVIGQDASECVRMPYRLGSVVSTVLDEELRQVMAAGCWFPRPGHGPTPHVLERTSRTPDNT